jgi:hypothetical protein
MTKTILFAAAFSIAGCLSVASAMPTAPMSMMSDITHEARLVCDSFGRCYRTRPRYRDYGYRRGYGGGGPNCYYNGCCPRGMTIQDGVCKPYRGP